MADSERGRVELGLSVGGYLNVKLAHRNDGQRWTARLIGFLEGEGVIISTPTDGSAPVPFYAHDEVTVRYLAGKEIHGFSTWIRRVSAEPFPHLHLAFPQAVERVPFRQEERVSLSLQATYQSVTQSDESGEAVIRDLSASGAKLQGPGSLGLVGDEVRLRFGIDFAGLEKQIEVSGIICNIKAQTERGAENASALYGLQFRDLDEQSRLFIKGFVYEKLIQHRE